MKRSVKAAIAGGVLFVLVTVSALVGFPALVRGEVSERAERRGIQASVGSVRASWKRVWLRDVKLRVADVPAVTVVLTDVEVPISAELKPAAISVHGAKIVVSGTLDDVRKQVEKWRSRRLAAASGSRTPIRVRGADLVWRGAAPDALPQYAWGLSYERDEQVERIGADLVRLVHAGLAVESGGLRLEIARVDGERALKSIASKRLDAFLDLRSKVLTRAVRRAGGARATPSLAPSASATPAPATVRPAADKKRSESEVPPFKRPLLSLDSHRGERWRSAFRRLTDVARLALPEAAVVDLGGLTARVTDGAKRLNIGPGRLKVSRNAKRLSVELMPGNADQASPLSLSMNVPMGAGDVEVAVKGGPVSVAWLGLKEGDMGLTGLAGATVRANAKFLLTHQGALLRFDGDASVKGIGLQHRWLAPQPLTGIKLGVKGKGQLSVDGSNVQVHTGQLSVGELTVEGKAELWSTRDGNHFKAKAAVPLAACDGMLKSSPKGLLPLLEGLQMNGTFAFKGEIDFDTQKPKALLVDWTVANECKITGTPADIAPRKFSQTWSRQVVGANGEMVSIFSGPGAPGWVPRTAISRHMETAVLICEDGAFFRHNGFDNGAIRNSIKMNVEAGRFIRGASTISMQLAKNLYLTREKTISRKLQEAILTMLLEQELTKDQMMGLYLNVIEFGPGIYGIGPAAAHYFNTNAGSLSLGQALYLASILPNPKRQHFGADGKVTPGWSNYLRRLMRIALKMHRITEEEYEDFQREQVTFKVPYSPRLPAEDEELPDGSGPAGDDAVDTAVDAAQKAAPWDPTASDDGG